MTNTTANAALAAEARRDENPLFGNMLGRLRHAVALRITRRKLLELDDRMLKDIGLTRGQAAHGDLDIWSMRGHPGR